MDCVSVWCMGLCYYLIKYLIIVFSNVADGIFTKLNQQKSTVDSKKYQQCHDYLSNVSCTESGSKVDEMTFIILKSFFQ